MNSKDYKNLLEEYEKLNKSRPESYPLTFEKYVEGFKRPFSLEGYINAPYEKKVKVAISWLRDACSYMKCYIAFKKS